MTSFLTLLHFVLLFGGTSSYSTQIESSFWVRDELQQRIHYGRTSASVPTSPSRIELLPPPILVLNGFGVGWFHWERNMAAVAAETGSTVFAMDYLGQGESWPINCNDGKAPSEEGVKYSIDSWVLQTQAFIEEIIHPQEGDGKVILVGNSLGGLIATILAARRSDLVDRIALLNATPVWGSKTPSTIYNWDGTMPPPGLPRIIGRFAYDTLRSKTNIENLLAKTYFDAEASLADLPEKIRSVTERSTGGHAAFASILWSPPATFEWHNAARQEKPLTDFYDLLSRGVVQDVLLLYGSEDPWCSPEFGRCAMRALESRGQLKAKSTSKPSKLRQRYIELSRSGHCPHHESPDAVNKLLSQWVLGGSEADFGGVGLFDKGVAATEVTDSNTRSLWEEILTTLLR